MTSACLLPSPSYDVEVGYELAAQTEREVGRYDEYDLESYVEAIGERLVAQLDETPFRYRFRLLDQAEPNAFAAPGGFVFVSRGLVALARSEDELAGVLAHEIVHVEKRHSVKRVSTGILPGVLQIPGGLVGILVSRDLGDALRAPFAGVGALTSATYGRSQESESDRLGQQLAARAGYDPAALAPMLDRIERASELRYGDSPRPSFFDTHPPTPSRSRTLRELADTLDTAPRPAEALDDHAFLDRIDGVLFGPNPAYGEFREQRFLHPGLGLSIEFPAGWTTIHTTTLAGAVEPERGSFVVLGILDESPESTDEQADSEAIGITSTPRSPGPGGDEEERRARIDELADARRDELTGRGLLLERDEKTEAAGSPARLLVFAEAERRTATRIFQVWFERGEVVHQLVGSGNADDVARFLGVLASARDLTDTERDSFRIERVRVVTAAAGETYPDVARRIGADVDPELSAAINDLDLETPLRSGTLVKLVRAEPYRPLPLRR
jgi:predicted Zn-dependent protease